LTRYLRARGDTVGAGQLMGVLAELQTRVRQGLAPLGGYDLLLNPVLAVPQAEIGYFTSASEPADDFDRQRRFSPFCAIFNVTGQPSVTVPTGATSDGLPVGVLLSGRYGDDARLLAAAAQLERLAGRVDRHPAIWKDAPSATVNGV
jgi:amidase